MNCPQPGSFLLWKKTGTPILIVRGKDDVIRAFYNTCRHRGGPLVKTACGKVDGLVCGYHGWTYVLDGKLVNLRDKRDFPSLDMSSRVADRRALRALLQLGVHQRGPGRAAAARAHAAVLRLLPAVRARTAGASSPRRRFDVKCNVKVLLDAFLEVYHLKSIHQDTVDRFLDHRGTTIALYRNGHSIMVTPNRRPDWQDPGTRGMRRIESATVVSSKNNPSFNFYPNLVAPVDPSGVPFLLFWPTSDTSMRIECHWFAPDWGGGPPPELWKTRIANFDRILDEDLQFGPQIQESLMSPGFRGIPLELSGAAHLSLA